MPIDLWNSWLLRFHTLGNGGRGAIASIFTLLLIYVLFSFKNRELKRLNQQFESAIRYAPIGIALVSFEGYWLKVNRALCDLLGYSEEELLQIRFQDLTYPEDLKLDKEYAQRLLNREKESFQIEKRYYTKSGEIIWALLAVSLALDPNDKPLYFISQIKDITEQRNLEEELRRLAVTDALTGLFNRRFLEDYFHKETFGRSVTAIAVIDINNFKTINDGKGHSVGDKIIQDFAKRISKTLESGEIAARTGGDEFCIAFSTADPSPPEGEEQKLRPARWGQDLLASLEQPFIFEDAGGQESSIMVTASVGIAFENSNQKIDFSRLFQQADLAMYAAKTQGGNRLQIFQEDKHRSVATQFEWENAIKRAIASDEFLIYFQPIVNLQKPNYPIAGVEALCRWNDPYKGILTPDTFFPYAEKNTSLLIALCQHLYEKTCLTIARWFDRYALDEDFFVSINMSAPNFEQPNFIKDIQKGLDISGLPPNRIKLEVTEQVAGLTSFSLELRALSNLGILLSLDDFGQGYSAFARLLNACYDDIKIDKAFVSGMGDGRIYTVVRCMIYVAKELNASCVAEGIESEAIAQTLIQLNCDYGQGWHFGRPMPEETLIERFFTAK